MARPKGAPNKLTAEVKDKLQCVMDEVVSSFNISTFTTDQKIKMLQIGLQYLLPRLKHISEDRDSTDYPLFISDAKLVTFNIHSRNQETGGFDVKSSTSPNPT